MTDDEARRVRRRGAVGLAIAAAAISALGLGGPLMLAFAGDPSPVLPYYPAGDPSPTRLAPLAAVVARGAKGVRRPLTRRASPQGRALID